MKALKKAGKPRVYDHSKIEKKWQKYWDSKKLFKAKDKGKKFYSLIEFPFASGKGLHVGHIRSNTAMDVISHKRRMQGYNVLYPIGWDSFGLPTENYAIKTGKQPAVITKENTSIFKKQLKALGFSFDWSREIDTSDPTYYKWTQWIFLQFFKKGLAYKKKMAVNWCPKDLIVLANEEVVDGKCERCGTPVEKKEKEQWMLAITKYADRLDKDLDETDYWEKIKTQQRNWIGKSEGAEINFPLIFETKNATKTRVVMLHGYNATPQADFYPWLKTELEKKGFEVEVPTLPNTKNPTEEEQVSYVLKNVTFTPQTILLGHSLGSVVAMKVLEKLDTKIAGLITVGGFIDAEFKDHDRSFDKKFIWNFDFKKIRANTGFIRVLHDIHDDAITDTQAERLAAALGVSVETCTAHESHFCAPQESKILELFVPSIKVFTTRPDTLYGVTYIVMSPEHLWVQLATDENHKGVLKNRDEVLKYIKEVKGKTDIERTALDKEKTGVELKGVRAINLSTNEEIPIWLADYVLADYGTGAVMAVPAHDDRDYIFAKKYNLPIKEVLVPNIIDRRNPPIAGKLVVERKNVHAIARDVKTGKYLALKWKKFNWTTFPMGGIEQGEDVAQAAIREIREETGFTNLKVVRALEGQVRAEYFAAHKDQNRVSFTTAVLLDLLDHTQEKIAEEESDAHDTIWLDEKDLNYDTMTHAEIENWKQKIDAETGAYTGEGILLNSGKFNGKKSENIKKEITESVGGQWVTKFKLRDWVFSRQRYWGEPIPVVHCDSCGVVPLPEKDLPLKLPKVKKYKPTETGESPLAAISSWVNTTCPTCKGKARRETDTMPNWAGSSWYYLRYVDSKNTKTFADIKKLKYWTPVDWYNGGMEHTVLHLLYSRFWHKFLYDLKLVPTKEPYQKRTSHGLILAGGGEKMSKSKGNIVNPDEIVKTVGADALRLYEMFMGPFDQHIVWDENGIVGTRRFVEKVWRLRDKVGIAQSTETLINKTIKKVSEDIEGMRFNTAISSMMIAVNEMEKLPIVSENDYSTLLQLLAPFAPHVAEELWQSLDNTTSLFVSKWPVFDPTKIVESTVKMIVQVNGKTRSDFEIGVGAGDDEVKKISLNLPEIKKWIENKDIKKVIVVKDRLVNIVL